MFIVHFIHNGHVMNTILVDTPDEHIAMRVAESLDFIEESDKERVKFNVAEVNFKTNSEGVRFCEI